MFIAKSECFLLLNQKCNKENLNIERPCTYMPYSSVPLHLGILGTKMQQRNVHLAKVGLQTSIRLKSKLTANRFARATFNSRVYPNLSWLPQFHPWIHSSSIPTTAVEQHFYVCVVHRRLHCQKCHILSDINSIRAFVQPPVKKNFMAKNIFQKFLFEKNDAPHN